MVHPCMQVESLGVGAASSSAGQRLSASPTLFNAALVCALVYNFKSLKTDLVCMLAAQTSKHRMARKELRPGIALPAIRLSVDVFSDIACPWCYVAKKRLDRAIKQFHTANGHAYPVAVKWHPFILDPSVSHGGEDRVEYSTRRSHSKDWLKALQLSATPDGATFKDWRVWPHTAQAHELVLMAAEEGKDSKAVELLFRRTYEHGGNVSQLRELLAIGAALQLHSIETRLAQASYKGMVQEEDAAAKRELGIKEVPYLVFTAAPHVHLTNVTAHSSINHMPRSHATGSGPQGVAAFGGGSMHGGTMGAGTSVHGSAQDSVMYAIAGAQRPERLLALMQLVVAKAQAKALQPQFVQSPVYRADGLQSTLLLTHVSQAPAVPM